jgi:hypothetical protein
MKVPFLLPHSCPYDEIDSTFCFVAVSSVEWGAAELLQKDLFGRGLLNRQINFLRYYDCLRRSLSVVLFWRIAESAVWKFVNLSVTHPSIVQSLRQCAGTSPSTRIGNCTIRAHLNGEIIRSSEVLKQNRRQHQLRR